MRTSTAIAILLLLGAATSASWWAFRKTPEVTQPRVAQPLPEPLRPQPGGPEPVSVDFKATVDPGIPEDQRLRMPDGSFVPTLNGVKNPAAIVWGNQPYSPIVRKQIDPHCEWYLHADGTYTTTVMTWRSDLGREDAVTLCLHPAKALPLEGAPDEGMIGPTKK